MALSSRHVWPDCCAVCRVMECQSHDPLARSAPGSVNRPSSGNDVRVVRTVTEEVLEVGLQSDEQGSKEGAARSGWKQWFNRTGQRDEAERAHKPGGASSPEGPAGSTLDQRAGEQV